MQSKKKRSFAHIVHTKKLWIYIILLSVGGQIELLQGVRRSPPELTHWCRLASDVNGVCADFACWLDFLYGWPLNLKCRQPVQRLVAEVLHSLTFT